MKSFNAFFKKIMILYRVAQKNCAVGVNKKDVKINLFFDKIELCFQTMSLKMKRIWKVEKRLQTWKYDYKWQKQGFLLFILLKKHIKNMKKRRRRRRRI